MRYPAQLSFVAIFALLVAACPSGDGGDDSGGTFEDFLAEVKLVAGAGAIDCGHVILGSDRSVANCCVATNFIQSLPFSATFDEQGIDSRVATGIALDAGGTTTIFFFDGGLFGSNQPDNGVINSQICNNPTLTQNACSDPSGFPLKCD